MGLPSILITFKAKAASVVQRSERGIVLMIINEATASTYSYATLSEVPSSRYTAANYKFIEDAFHDGCYKVIVVAILTSTDIDDIKTDLDEMKFNWACSPVTGLQADLVTYIKARNVANPNRQVKCVAYNQTANDKHIVNFINTSVYRKGNSTAVNGYEFTPRIAGMLAATPFTRSATYYIFDDLDRVTEPANVDTAINAGQFVIINDYGEPKVARAINSMTTLGTGDTDSMKKITIVEAMDLIKEDIDATFRSTYIGKYKNNLDNQQTFIAAINNYFYTLADDDILDNTYDNVAEVDVASQRAALISGGYPEAVDWDEITVMKHTVGSNVYLAGQVKILDAIEDLQFTISMA